MARAVPVSLHSGWTALSVVLLWPGAVLAQGGTIIDQNRIDRQAPRPDPSVSAPPVAATQVPAIAADLGSAVPLRKVEVAGSSLPTVAFAQAMRPFVGHRLDRATVQAAALAVANIYKRSNIALYTIQAPSQNLSDGVLRLRVREGYVAAVAIQGQFKRPPTLAKAYAAKIADEKPLSRRTLERDLSLIRDIPGVTVEPQLLQGQGPGAVVLNLPMTAKASNLNISVTNRGNAILGRAQVQADYSRYGLFRSGDSTTFTAAVPTEIDKFQYVALAHSQPLGADGLRLQGSAGYLRTRPGGGRGRGHATIGSLQLSYPAIRSYAQNLYLTLALDGLDSSNAILGAATADEKTAVARGSAAWTLVKPKYALLASATGSAGHVTLGGAYLPGAADRDFQKFNARLGADRLLGKRWAIHARGVAQVSGDRLPSSELFSLGGDEFGRAFNQSTLVGDKGLAGSLQLGWRPGGLPKATEGTELFVFTDAGRVDIQSRFGLPARRLDLASAGAGVQLAWKRNTVIGLDGAYALDTPVPGARKSWRLGFSFRTLR